MASCSYCPAVGLYKWRDKFACRKHMPTLQRATVADSNAKSARHAAADGFNQDLRDKFTVIGNQTLPGTVSAMQIKGKQPVFENIFWNRWHKKDKPL